MTREIFFFRNLAENEARKDFLIPDFFLFFKKALYEVKASFNSLVELSFNIF